MYMAKRKTREELMGELYTLTFIIKKLERAKDKLIKRIHKKEDKHGTE